MNIQNIESKYENLLGTIVKFMKMEKLEPLVQLIQNLSKHTGKLANIS
jgi:hypothetical protein